MNFGLLTKREAWCLTWRGWLLTMVLTLTMFLVGVRGCAPFLSPNRPVAAEVLIVEGWLPDYALKHVAEEFRLGKYRYIITAGGPLPTGYYNTGPKTSAELAASTLVALGIASNLVVAVPAPPVLRERTLAHAQAVKRWIQTNDPVLRSVNAYTLGAHARRSRLVFERVLGDRVKVGIIAQPDGTYDLDHWWGSSEGFRTVTGEALAYLWCRLAGRA